MYAAVHRIKPGYKDVFRRVRELQGEEGLHGLVKDKTTYQLQNLAIKRKREPRKAISPAAGREIALNQGSRCAICGTVIVVNGDPVHVDHRIPRDRGGPNEISNYQVLCASCNVAKSSACSGCDLTCQTCPWAYPEKYRMPRIRHDIIHRLNEMAQRRNRNVDDLTNEIIDKFFSK